MACDPEDIKALLVRRITQAYKLSKADQQAEFREIIKKANPGCSIHAGRAVPHDCNECSGRVLMKADILEELDKWK